MSESLRELEARRSALLAAIYALQDMRPGSIVGAVRRCRKATCHCAQPNEMARVNDQEEGGIRCLVHSDLTACCKSQ